MNNRVTLVVALTIFACLVARTSLARTCTWNAGSGGTGGDNWSTTTAWSCGSGGNGPPAAADTVVFDGTSIRPCAIDAVANVTSISINSGYTGTVTQNSAKVVSTSGGFTLGAGTFVGGSNTLLSVGGAFTMTAGAFTHNGGILMLSSASDQTFASNGATFNNLIVGNGLVGYWNLDEGAGTSLGDHSGLGNTGTLHGPTWVTGNNLQTMTFTDAAGLNFDSSSNNYATLGVTNLPALDANKTIAFWAYWASKPASSGNMVVMRGAGLVQVGFNGSSQLIKVWSSGTIFAASTSTPASGWHHIAYTWDGTTNRLYIDGGTPATTTTAPGASATSTAWLGTYDGTHEFFNGRLDDVRIYNRALSAADITLLAGGGVPTSGTQTVTGNPVIASNLLITAGTLAGGNTAITVAKNWYNYGAAFTTGTTGGVTFNGSAAGNTILANGSAFNNLTINGTGDWTLADTSYVTVGGNLAISAGTLKSTPGTLEIKGAFNKTGGVFTHNSGEILLSSSASQTLATNGTTFYNLNINDGLVGYWKLDDTSSPSVDSSGFGQDATWSTSSPASSTTVPTVPFADSHSLNFDNSSTAAVATFTSVVDTPLITITAWIKPIATGGGNYNRIVELPGTPLWITNSTVSGDNKMALGMNSYRDTNAHDGRWNSAANSITYGVWQHVAMTYDSTLTTNAPVMYVGGVSSAVTQITADPVNAQVSNVGTGYIGNRIDATQGASLDRNFNGLIDELRIYKRILSAAEIASLAAGNRPAGIATQTLTGNLNVAGALTIDSGTLATSSYTASVTGATSVTSGGLTVGSNNVTLSGGLVQQAQGIVTENTTGGHIILGTGQTSTYSDTAGTIQGFPTAAFDWSTFAYWNTYVAFRDFSGTTDRLFARSADGAPKYYWDLPAGVGDIVGTPRWNMEGSTHYVYLLTTLGRVYKLSDDGTAFAVVSGWPYFNGSSATGTSPLVSDSNNLYWCGNDSAGARQMFSLSLSTTILNTTRALVGDVVAAPALATVSSLDYLYTATSGKVYRTPVTLASEITNTQPTTTVNGRITVLGGRVMFAEDNGTVWALSSTDLSTTWSYQDTNASRHPGSPACSAGNQCSVASFYYDNALARTFFGDHDGHLYALDSSGALVSNYPWRPGLSTDTFLTAPLYRSGVIVIGTSGGKVFVVDQNGGSGPSLIRTYTIGSAISSISFNSSAGSGGAYAIGTANGNLYYLPNESDPTSGSN